ncbi:hypothetical protein Gotri_023846 [Gossypium trilobum]|uniref:RNase H type-1 domain-containing protein n=1 Tax=Gossypium trilobum TaxID=34281 RepID=A0A7J9DKB7_9ROSI|nr:hypothetical protein [Gossypium trilobum]
MLPKIKIFSWRIGHNILLTFDNIARIRQGFNNTCPRCKSSEDTLIHVMKDCPKACEILVAGGLNNILLDGNYNNCIDWIEDVFWKMGAAVMIWERAQTLSKDFRIFNLTEPSIISPNQVKKGWTKPLTGYVKVNVDASVSNGCRVVRVVARDHDGFVIRGYYNFKENSMDVIWAELEAFQEGLKLAEKLKVAQLIVESDSATLVNTVIIMGQRIRQECKAFNNFDSVPGLSRALLMPTACPDVGVPNRQLSFWQCSAEPSQNVKNDAMSRLSPSPFGTRASGTLGPWSCGSLVHHRHYRPLVALEHRVPSAHWCLNV